MKYHSLSLTLPAGLDDPSAVSLVSVACDLAGGSDNPPLSGTAARVGNDHRNDWRLEWLFAEPASPEDFLPVVEQARVLAAPELAGFEAGAFEAGEIPETNWLERSYQQFQPFEESGFFVYGSHAPAIVPPNRIGLQIDAATAFGSGEHGTTAGCLQALAELKQGGFVPSAVLDLGAGSGILAIAACKLWDAPVLATDIDPEAVRVSTRHCGFNDVGDRVANIVSDGFQSPDLQAGAPYQLTIANILAGPLKEMARDIVAATADGGVILLSGMLKEQVEDVQPVYEALGCGREKLILRGDWAALILRKAA